MKTVMRGKMDETEWAHEECVLSATGGPDMPLLQLIRYVDKPAPEGHMSELVQMCDQG